MKEIGGWTGLLMDWTRKSVQGETRGSGLLKYKYKDKEQRTKSASTPCESKWAIEGNDHRCGELCCLTVGFHHGKKDAGLARVEETVFMM